jgi:hypothetical protein
VSEGGSEGVREDLHYTVRTQKRREQTRGVKCSAVQ